MSAFLFSVRLLKEKQSVLIQVKQGCTVLDISGMFSKCFAGGIEVVRVRHCLRNFTPPKKENKKIILRLFFLYPSSSLSLSIIQVWTYVHMVCGLFR